MTEFDVNMADLQLALLLSVIALAITVCAFSLVISVSNAQCAYRLLDLEKGQRWAGKYIAKHPKTE